jgi:hypothetical protein
MIRRVISLLLIPLLLASQGLCFGHSHRGGSVVESEGHDARPHFHIHGHRHHHHGGHHHHGAKHQSKADALKGFQPVDSHDDNAIYLAATVMFSTMRNVAAQWLAKHWLDVPFAKVVAHEVVVSDQSGYLWNQAPPIDSACPLYLRTHSLRC